MVLHILYIRCFSFTGYFCPECGSDHVVQLGGQTTPYSSTPIHHSLVSSSENDHFDTAQTIYSANKAIKVFMIFYTYLFLFVLTRFSADCCYLIKTGQLHGQQYQQQPYPENCHFFGRSHLCHGPGELLLHRGSSK